MLNNEIDQLGIKRNVTVLNASIANVIKFMARRLRTPNLNAFA